MFTIVTNKGFWTLHYRSKEMELLIIAALWTLINLTLVCQGITLQSPRIQYTRDQLLQWNMPNIITGLQLDLQYPDCIYRKEYIKSATRDNSSKAKKRKRGKRGGVRQWLRKQQLTRIPLPSFVLGNVQSLRNKLDELQGNVRFLREYRDSCVMAFTESWLTEQDLDSDLFIDGFGIPFRLDRKAVATGKSRGGGVCLCQQALL